METRTDILNELKVLSPVLYGIEKTTIYSVPDGYFNDLDKSLLSTVLNKESELLTGISRQNNQQVPEGYFDTLAGSILSKIKSAETQGASGELRELSPMLYSVQNESVYSVPSGYFAGLPDNIIKKVQPKAKVIPLQKRNNWLRYAAAAVITGIISVSVLIFINNPGNPATIAGLDAYIEKGKQMDDKQFNATLNELSSDEIISYLENNGDENDIAMLSQNIDDNTLPAEEDYFTDDQALEKYLKQLDSEPGNN